MRIPEFRQWLLKLPSAVPSLLGMATVLSLFIVATRIIDSGGRVYSPVSKDYSTRIQTQALKNGRFDVGVGSNLAYEHSWSMGKVQQVWGLGLPLLLLAGDAVLAPFLEQPMMPDRILFILVMALVLGIWANLIRSLRNPSQRMGIAALTLLLGLHPVVLANFRGRFFHYEQVACFSVLWNLLILSLLSAWLISRRAWVWLVLGFVAGFAPLIRPTGILAGTFAWAIAVASFRSRSISRRTLIAGCALFTVPIVFLAWSNQVRFGAWWSLGYETMASFDIWDFAMRFGNPYQLRPLGSPELELFGWLFDAAHLERWADVDLSLRLGGENFHPSFSFQDLLAILIAFSVVLSSLAVRLRQTLREKKLSILSPSSPSKFEREAGLILFAWGAVLFLALAGVYVRQVHLASRYLFEFFPAVMAMLLGAVLLIEYPKLPWSGRGFWNRWRSPSGLFLTFLLCYTLSLLAKGGSSLISKSEAFENRPVTKAELINSIALVTGPSVNTRIQEFSTRYECESILQPTMLPFKFDIDHVAEKCSSPLLVTARLLVSSCVALDLAPKGWSAEKLNPIVEEVRARIGIEELVRGKGRRDPVSGQLRLVFCRKVPKEPRVELVSFSLIGKQRFYERVIHGIPLRPLPVVALEAFPLAKRQNWD